MRAPEAAMPYFLDGGVEKRKTMLAKASKLYARARSKAPAAGLPTTAPHHIFSCKPIATNKKPALSRPPPLLAQVPLTISPFLSLPTSVPLPYSYKTLPSTLPPSILSPSPQQQQNPQDQQPAYIQSASGTTSTPDAILASCLALQQHLQKLEDDAKRVLGAWERRRQEEDLAEKRRVAPGWLDSGVHILKPDEGVGGGKGNGREDGSAGGAKEEVMDLMDDDPQQREAEKRGEELDRVFGGLKV